MTTFKLKDCEKSQWDSDILWAMDRHVKSYGLGHDFSCS